MCKIKTLPVKVTLFIDVLQPQTKGFRSDHTHTSEVLFKTDYSLLSPAKRILKACPSLNQLFCPPAHTGTVTEATPNSCLCHRSVLTFTYLETFPIHHSPHSSTKADSRRMQETKSTQKGTLSHRAASTSGTSTLKPDQ